MKTILILSNFWIKKIEPKFWTIAYTCCSQSICWGTCGIPINAQGYQKMLTFSKGHSNIYCTAWNASSRQFMVSVLNCTTFLWLHYFFLKLGFWMDVSVKKKYQDKINMKQEMRVKVFSFIPRSEKLCHAFPFNLCLLLFSNGC